MIICELRYSTAGWVQKFLVFGVAGMKQPGEHPEDDQELSISPPCLLPPCATCARASEQAITRTAFAAWPS